MSAGKVLLGENATTLLMRGGDHVQLVLLLEVERHHGGVGAEAKSVETTCHRLAGQTNVANQAFFLKPHQRFQRVSLVKQPHVVAIGMQQYAVKMIRFETLQTTLYGKTDMLCGEVKATLTVFKF